MTERLPPTTACVEPAEPRNAGPARFAPDERALLLAAAGIGPVVVSRLEEAGLDSLQKLRHVGVDAAIDLVNRRLGARTWGNRRRPLRRALAAMSRPADLAQRP